MLLVVMINTRDGDDHYHCGLICVIGHLGAPGVVRCAAEPDLWCGGCRWRLSLERGGIVGIFLKSVGLWAKKIDKVKRGKKKKALNIAIQS